MASFELKILTEDPTELKELVDKLCTKVNNGGYVSSQELQAMATPRTPEPSTIADQAKYDAAKAAGVVAEVATMPEHTNVAREPQDVLASVVERDAEGLKRDARIHSDAAEPFKADGTWKRKRNTPDDVYESVYEELAREAHAAGLYKGPLLGQFELESKVVDEGGPYYWAHDETDTVGVCKSWEEIAELQKGEPLIDPIGKEAYDTRVADGATIYQAAPVAPVAPSFEPPVVAPAPVALAPVAEAAPAPAPVAPAPQAAPAPAPVAPAPQAAPAGLSAQVSASEQRCKDLLTSMIKQVGPTVAVASLRMFGGAHAITVLTPEQREQFCNVAEALIASGATAADGHEKMLEITSLMGVAV